MVRPEAYTLTVALGGQWGDHGCWEMEGGVDSELDST